MTFSACGQTDNPQASTAIPEASVQASATVAIETAPPTTLPPALTDIVIDGDGSDWVDRPLVYEDAAGDAEEGFLDLTTAYAFVNQDALYVLVNVVDPTAAFVQFDFELSGDEQHQMLTWRPGRSGMQFPNSKIVFGSALEARIDLRDIGSPETVVRLTEIRVMVGEDPPSPDWRAADVMKILPKALTWVNESDSPVKTQERTERPAHFYLETAKAAGDYLYRVFIQTPAGMDVGPDGKLYIADWNGRHIVSLTPDGDQSDLGLWRNPEIFANGGPQDVAFDPAGELYFTGGGFIYHYLGDGAAERVAGTAGWPNGLAFGADGTLYYTDGYRGNVYRLKLGGVAESLTQDNLPMGIAVSADGMVYYNRWPAGDIVRIDTSSGEIEDFQLGVCNFDPCFLDIDPEGDLWARGIFDLRQFSPDSNEKPYMLKIGGNIVPGNDHNWHSSAGIALDPEGNLWIASYNSWVHRLALTNPGDATPIFERQVISVGFEASDLDVGPDGTVYATDLNGGQVLGITTDGETTPIVVHGSAGREAVAVDAQGIVYYSAFGEILRVKEAGSPEHYASLQPDRMIFGADGNLYASVIGKDNQHSLVRITGVDQVETIANDLNGDVFGNKEVFLMRAPDNGLLVLVRSSSNLYHMNYAGDAELIAHIPGEVLPAAASPTTGTVYFLMVDPDRYTLKRIDLNGTIRILGNSFSGDPWGMAVSPDGKWLYIAESGAIDKISLE